MASNMVYLRLRSEFKDESLIIPPVFLINFHLISD